MAYENIRLKKPNMAVSDDGYFFSIDEYHQILIQKCDDGFVSFQYPLEISSEFYIDPEDLDEVTCLQFDGFSFWSLHKFTDLDKFVIRRWMLDDVLCNLHNQFILQNVAGQYYDINTISVESYQTTISSDILDGSTELSISEYTDTKIFPDTVIGLGPNKFGNRELVTVSGVVENSIYLTSELQYPYESGDGAVITPSIFVFNNYDGTDDTEGSIITLDANTGAYISSQGHIEYLNISASKFTRLQGVLRDYPDVYTLLYVKGNSGKLRKMDDLLGENVTYRGNDNFDGAEIDTDIWTIFEGDPLILNNKLYMSTAVNGHDKITSKYVLLRDFDVQISGSYYGYQPNPGHHEAYRYIAINEKYSDDEYLLSRTTYSGAESFDVIKNSGGSYEFLSTISGSQTDYSFRIKRAGKNISFFYSDTTSSGWSELHTETLFDTECYISLGLNTQDCTISGSYFDDFIYSSGRLTFPSSEIEFFGVMNLDNIKTDQATYIEVNDLDIVGDNLYRLQNKATYYGNDYIWGTYNYQVSPIRSFVDFITVDSDTHIIPATGRNTAEVQALVLDQYGEGVSNKPITFIDDDDIGYMLTKTVYTNSYLSHGNAISNYMSGTDLRIVTINVSATQYD